jgi:ribosome-associated protein
VEIINIETEYIKIDQLLKFIGIADNGGFAKIIIKNGDVKVNNIIVTERGKKIRNNDIVKIEGGGIFKVVVSENSNVNVDEITSSGE